LAQYPAFAPGTSQLKVIGFAGWSSSGKTTLIEALIGIFRARELCVSLVKRAHHEFDVDVPGKDSYRHRHAGCQEVMISSSRRWVLMNELRGAGEVELDELLSHLAPCDLVLVEGYKFAPIPKIEVHRPETGKPLIYPNDPHVVALAADAVAMARIECPLPRLDLNNASRVADFVLDYLGLRQHPAPRLAAPAAVEIALPRVAIAR
jgi:molybdopterin-guanine dinucleotide biosynthesis protein B